MNLEPMTMVGSYDYRLVVLSVFIAILASYAALDLAGRVTATGGLVRLAWLSGGASAMGFGIWSMHYIGMLAFSLPVPVSYDWPTVVVSLVAAIFASGVALYVVSRPKMGPLQAVAGSIFMGAGIAAMHYIGMEAMRAAAMCHYDPWIVTLSVALAIIISFVAILLAFHFREDHKETGWRKLASAVVMGAAIPVMHYTGMAAVSYTHSSVLLDTSQTVSISSLGAAGIVIVTLMVLSLTLLTSMVDRRFSAQTLELQASEEHLRLIIASALDSVVSIDAEGRVAIWNPQAEATFGWSGQEAIGKVLSELIVPPQYREALDLGLKHFLTTGQSPVLNKRIEVTALHRDGHEVPVELAISAVTMGRAWSFNAFIRDITESKRAEAELTAAKEAAESASRSKSEFLANMSHEIRTPMNAIVGMTELALDTELTREQREYLTTVKTATDSLLTLINDILDFSKIEAGKLEIDRIGFQFRETLEDTMRTLALRAHEKGLELACRVPPEMPDSLVGDPDRLKQIIVNLVGNAVKFTAHGEVVLNVDVESQTDEEVGLHFAVKDTGIGIPAEKQQVIFEAFTQADSSTTRQFGGTGLGLVIATRLVQMMGGKLWLESEVGKGSTFHFTVRFPCQKSPAQKSAPAESSNLIDLPVLIVDDNATNCRILEEILSKWAMRPTSARSGADALAVLESAMKAGEPFPLMILDVNMPGMDGFEVAERVTKNPALSGATIMMLSSATRPGDIARCKEAGVAAYLMKPVRRGELLESILEVLGNQAARPDHVRISKQRSANERRRGISILLVEDNPVNQMVALRLLEKHGHRVLVAGNGREALLALEKTAFQGFDLVLMDLQMPEMDGLQATAAIREREHGTGCHIPIVAMTAHAMKGDKERCLAAGMDGYLSKPIRTRELFEVIENLAGAPAATGEEPSASPPQAEVMDKNSILSVFEGDTELIREVVELFLADCPRQMSAIRDAVQHSDAEAINRAAHSLKGSLSNFAAPVAFQAAQRLEGIGRDGDLRHAGEALRLLEEQISLLQSAMADLEKKCAA